MTSVNFCYWLQGYFEIYGKSELSKEQVEMIRNHLSLVFKQEINPNPYTRDNSKNDQIGAYIDIK